MGDKQSLINSLRREIMEDMAFGDELSDEQIQELISHYLLRQQEGSSFSLQERKRIGKEIFYSLRKLDVLQELLEDESVTEIMVNGPTHIFIEQGGRMKRLSTEFESGEKLLQVIQQIVAGCNRTVNEASPIVDARLPGGSRVNVVLYPIALNGPILTIRRFSASPMTMDRLKEYGAVSQEVIYFLQKAVKARYNILVSGGTGSGKTTFLNALSQYIPADERVITIEDSAELQLWSVENLIRMETRNANLEGGPVITIRDLIKASLRMRPDRIIVGEVRRQIASGIDLIVHLGRLRDKTRKVLEITEISGMKGDQIILNPLYRFQEAGEEKEEKIKGGLVSVGQLINRYKMESAGISYP